MDRQAQLNKDTRTKLGTQIRILREAKGLTQSELGELCGVGKAQISKIEKGNLSQPELRLLRIAQIFESELSFVYKTQQISNQPDVIKPRLSQDTPFLQDLIDAPGLSENRRTFAKLFGSIVATIKMLEIVTQNDYGDLTPEGWEFPELLNTLKDSIEHKGLIDFTHAEDFAAWSLGFFRNDVYRRLIIVLECCIFDWYEQEKLPQDKKVLPDIPLIERLKQLEEQKGVNKKAKRMIRQLIASISNYLERKKSIHEDIVSLLTNPQKFPKTLELTELSPKISKYLGAVECVALAYMFDITAPYSEEPYSITYNKYFVITVHALIWVAEFRRQLFS